MATSISFVQFQTCNVCNRNHRQGRRHIYSKKHTDQLNTRLKKFKVKVKEAAQVLSEPQVLPCESFGKSSHSFWCLMCEAEFARHVVMNSFCVVEAGFLEHLSSQKHILAVEKFWNAQLITSKSKDDFMVPCTVTQRYKATVMEKLKNLTEQIQAKLFSLRGTIEEKERRSREVLAVETLSRCHSEQQETSQVTGASAAQMPPSTSQSSEAHPDRQAVDIGPSLHVYQCHWAEERVKELAVEGMKTKLLHSRGDRINKSDRNASRRKRLHVPVPRVGPHPYSGGAEESSGLTSSAVVRPYVPKRRTTTQNGEVV